MSALSLWPRRFLPRWISIGTLPRRAARHCNLRNEIFPDARPSSSSAGKRLRIVFSSQSRTEAMSRRVQPSEASLVTWSPSIGRGGRPMARASSAGSPLEESQDGPPQLTIVGRDRQPEQVALPLLDEGDDLLQAVAPVHPELQHIRAGVRDQGVGVIRVVVVHA